MADLPIGLGTATQWNGPVAHPSTGRKQQLCTRLQPIDVHSSAIHCSLGSWCLENAAVPSSYQETYHFSGDSQSPIVRQPSDAALSRRHQQMSAQNWTQQMDSYSYSNQQLRQCDATSNVSGSADSYSGQALSDRTAYTCDEAELLDILEQMPELLASVQQGKIATDPVANIETMKTNLNFVDGCVFSVVHPTVAPLSSTRPHYMWDFAVERSYIDSSWLFSSTLELPGKPPVLTIIRQPPPVHRARYEKESKSGAKGLLKTKTREPIVIELENVAQGAGDVTVIISTVTIKGIIHPYVYPSCFGRGMPSDWTKDEKKRIVTIALKEKDGYRKSLSFLGIKRKKLELIDLTCHKKNELGHFRVVFEVAVPSTSQEFIPVTATTQPVRILCPSTATKLRKNSNEEDLSL